VEWAALRMGVVSKETWGRARAVVEKDAGGGGESGKDELAFISRQVARAWQINTPGPRPTPSGQAARALGGTLPKQATHRYSNYTVHSIQCAGAMSARPRRMLHVPLYR
jgi:hypothetical protein